LRVPQAQSFFLKKRKKEKKKKKKKNEPSRAERVVDQALTEPLVDDLAQLHPYFISR